MRNLLLLLTTLFIFNLQAGDLKRITHRSQRGDLAKRGKKRSQARTPKAASFNGLDVQLGQALNSTQLRDRKRVHREMILLDWTTQAGSAEQLGAVFKSLFEDHVDPNMRWAKKCNFTIYGSPLCNAAARGNVALVALLLSLRDKKGEPVVDPNEVCLFDNKEKNTFTTPLHSAARAREDIAAYDGHYSEVIDLLHTSGANVNAGGDSPDLPFTPAHIVALQRLRLSQRPKDEEFNAKKIGKQLSVMRSLIACGAELSILSFPEAHGKAGLSALEYAVIRKNKSLVEFLTQAELKQYEERRSDYTEVDKVLKGQKSTEKKAEKKVYKARRLRRTFKKRPQRGPASSSEVLADVERWG